MFKGLANLAQMLKQAKEAKARMDEMQERLGRLQIQGSAGGLVTVEMNGLQEVLGCDIDESLLRPEDRETVQDLVVVAMNEALRKLKEATAAEFTQLAGGMDLDSMKNMLSGLGLGSDQ